MPLLQLLNINFHRLLRRIKKLLRHNRQEGIPGPNVEKENRLIDVTERTANQIENPKEQIKRIIANRGR